MKNRDLRISEKSRKVMDFPYPVFQTDNGLVKMYRQAQKLAAAFNKTHEKKLSAAKLHTVAVINLVCQHLISRYVRDTDCDFFARFASLAEKNDACGEVIDFFDYEFPTKIPETVIMPREEMVRAFFLHQVFLVNPALLKATGDMMGSKQIIFPKGYQALSVLMGGYLKETKNAMDTEQDLFTLLTLPARLHPDSLTDQLHFIIENWKDFISDELLAELPRAIDFIKEEEKPSFQGPGPSVVPNFKFEDNLNVNEYEAFTEDRGWMPNVVMIAKSTLVWLDQLSKKYGRPITFLDQIPEEEIEFLKNSGFTALWLIGLWQRSDASKKIKNLCGNKEAEASAYSIMDYDISSSIGGWEALTKFREKCNKYGIKLASDMVPNHTGIDSTWVKDHPDYFIQQSFPPFPSYTYNGENLSSDSSFEIRIEDHYYDQTDAAVTFQRKDNKTGEISYIFHGNDGTSIPWNDTAQIDFLNSEAREAVIQQIFHVARNFPIIRFDAAMTLARKHIQRLWYPAPGKGGDIAGRTIFGLSNEEFNRRIPKEFWREVVDRVGKELPDTLLLAEAFWMMEGYFVRTLGMHRVYNSAFMNMLKNQENSKYRLSVKNTISYDPEILKRYVNFMNNPDEDSAILQFGDGDRYFGVCTLLATMPGLPMFGHGQIQGYREKYGMEFSKALWDEKPNIHLIEEHKRRIFPLLKKRNLFSSAEFFQLFDVINNDSVQESVFAYTNGTEDVRTFILYNNQMERVEGNIQQSSPKMVRKEDGSKLLETVNLAEALNLTMGGRRYIIYKDFNKNLTFITPSMKVFEDGYHVQLEGYETKVFVDIREVEDIDGIYSILYKKFGEKGMKDFEKEKRKIMLQPFFDTIDFIKGDKFRKHLDLLLKEKASVSSRKKFLQLLGEFYTYIEEFRPVLKSIGLEVKQTKPTTMVSLIERINEVSKEKPFNYGNQIIDNMVDIFTTMFILYPFVEKGDSLETLIKKSETLLVDNFLGCEKVVMYQGALLCTDTKDQIDSLLQDKVFLHLIGTNEYNGILWYKAEYFQECLYLIIISELIKNNEKSVEESEKLLAHWLKKDSLSQYKLDILRSTYV